ncbi:hypothetical protein BJX99DRAFT_213475 [Aspergillus californicus]
MLPHLPDEILILIAREMEPRQRLNLLSVCRRWQSMFFPLAYSEVHITGSRLSRLVRSIHSHREIASTIQTLSLKNMDVTVMPEGNDPAWIQGCVRRFRLTPAEFDRWLMGIAKGSSDYWTALLLCLLNTLVDLHMEYASDFSFTPLCMLRSATSLINKIPRVGRLKRVAIDQSTEIFLNPIVDIYPYFYLPSIRSISVTGLIDGGFPAGSIDPIQPAPPPSSMEEIKIECVCNGGFWLPKFIISCTNLKKLTFRNLHEMPFGAPRDRFLRDDFYTPLLTQKNSLEVLQLNYLGVAHDDQYDPAMDRDEMWDDRPYDRWLGSFADFTRLHTISMRVPNLLDLSADKRHLNSSAVDTLPKSLEYLSISYASEFFLGPLFDGLTEVLDLRAERFPNLKKITVCCQGPEMKVLNSHFQRIDCLKQDCKAAKVGLDFVCDGPAVKHAAPPFPMLGFATDDIDFYSGMAFFNGMSGINGINGMPFSNDLAGMSPHNYNYGYNLDDVD